MNNNNNIRRLIRDYSNIVQPFLMRHQEHAEQAFDIPSIKVMPTNTKRLNVSLRPQDTIGLLEVTIEIKQISTLEEGGWKLLSVCEDIEREIYSYLRDTTRLTILIDFRNNWPFWGPQLKLISCTKKGTEFQSLIHQFNCDIRSEWSPALGFSKFLLILINRILETCNYV